MKTIAQFFPAMHSQLTTMQRDIEGNPTDWHQALQAAINQGAFLKLEFGLGLAGVVDCRILLVSQQGEATTVSTTGDRA